MFYAKIVSHIVKIISFTALHTRPDLARSFTN